MNGFESTSYGNAFADVYDDWYENVSDVDATVAYLARRAGQLPALSVLELGVGTGRIALPLAAHIAPQQVFGIDSSDAMLQVLASKDPHCTVRASLGDMVDDLPEGPFALVFVAYNTFFSLVTAQRQQQCFDAIAQRLAIGGTFVIEAFVPPELPAAGDHIEVRTMTRDTVVLSISRSHSDRTIDGQFIQFSDNGGVRLRPWSILPTSPADLERMAERSGLMLLDRLESFSAASFSNDSDRHVSTFVRIEGKS